MQHLQDKIAINAVYNRRLVLLIEDSSLTTGGHKLTEDGLQQPKRSNNVLMSRENLSERNKL